MNRFWEGVKRMLGIGPTRHSSPPIRSVADDEVESKKQADLREAKRRVMALDLRVDVLTGRMDRHEEKPH